MTSSVKALQQEFKSLNETPVEGFNVKLSGDENFLDWEVALFGPPGTLYEGGYLKANLKFPNDYPYSPPSMTFITKMWHPNVYPDGKVCISILHPPGDDPFSGELPSERWNPTQSVRTILLSVISLLNEPNTSSPANVDASVMYRNWRDGNSTEYMDIVKQQMEATKQDAEKDGVRVPQSVEDYVNAGVRLGAPAAPGRGLDNDAFGIDCFDANMDDDATIDFEDEDC